MTFLRFVCGSFLLAACGSPVDLGSNTSPDGGGVAAGTSTSSGASGAGVATGGGGGGTTGGGGGSGGSAGVPGSAKPECATAADCRLQSDCCTCEALAPGEMALACDSVCAIPKCQEQQLAANSAACIAGRCVAGFECDASKVTCATPPPPCGAGTVAAVNGACYTGACVPVTECQSVTSCSECGGLACARYASQLATSNHCVSVPAACGTGITCSCIGASVCVGAFSSCGGDGVSRNVSCTCPNCS